MAYVLGKGWLQGCQGFWAEGEYNEFSDSFEFKPEMQGGKELKGYEVTLNPVPFGNAKTKRIDRNRFLEGDQQLSVQIGASK